MGGMKRVFSGLADTMQSVAAVGIGAAVILNLAQILYRYVLFDPLAWTEEVMRYVLVWVMMLGAGASLYRNEEVTAAMLGWIRSNLLQRSLHFLRIACVVVFGGILTWFGLPFALGASTQVSPAAQIPMFLPYLAFFAGGILILVMCVGMIVAPADAAEHDDVRPEDAL